jgi:hypothetical protein
MCEKVNIIYLKERTIGKESATRNIINRSCIKELPAQAVGREGSYPPC